MVTLALHEPYVLEGHIQNLSGPQVPHPWFNAKPKESNAERKYTNQSRRQISRLRGAKRLSKGGAKFEINLKKRSLQKRNLFNWVCQAC